MPKNTIPILTDDDQERLNELHRAVLVAERNAEAKSLRALRIGDDAPDPDLIETRAAYDAFLDEVTERAEAWVLQSIGFREFRRLISENPPRMVTKTAEDGTTTEEVHLEDEDWGVDTDEFPEALLYYIDPEDSESRTILELKVDGEDISTNTAAIRKRVRRLSEGQFKALWNNAFMLNKADVSDPKYNRFSPATPRSTET